MATDKRGLKRCPFCGSDGAVIRRYAADGVKLYTDRYAVLCDYRNGGCGAESGWYHSPEEAAAMWNQRKWRREK